jgi:alpha-D-xyloside xylohydrolase
LNLVGKAGHILAPTSGDKGRFHQPARLLDSLKRRGVRANLWINPFISPDGELYKPILPVLRITHGVDRRGDPITPCPVCKQLISGHFSKHLVSIGVSGFKMDENDGYDEWLWPDVARFPSGNAAEQMRQTYAMMMQKMTTSLSGSKMSAPMVLVRLLTRAHRPFPMSFTMIIIVTRILLPR